MSNIVEKRKNLLNHIGLLPLEDMLKKSKRSPAPPNNLMSFFFVGLQSGFAAEQHTKFLEMMKSEQKVVSELKSVLMLTSQSMMGLWEAEKANQTKKIDKLSKIVEQLQAAVVDLNQGPKRNASLPMNRPALPKMKTPVEETPLHLLPRKKSPLKEDLHLHTNRCQ